MLRTLATTIASNLNRKNWKPLGACVYAFSISCTCGPSIYVSRVLHVISNTSAAFGRGNSLYRGRLCIFGSAT